MRQNLEQISASIFILYFFNVYKYLPFFEFVTKTKVTILFITF